MKKPTTTTRKNEKLLSKIIREKAQKRNWIGSDQITASQRLASLKN
jgi:hypothetical protein